MTTDPHPADSLSLEGLRDAVAGRAAALRCCRRLQPGGGAGDKVFPPTFAGAVYARELRRIPGRTDPVSCILLDSVQSQANRMEEALQEAIDAGRIALPQVVVDFGAHDPTGDDTADDQAGRFVEAVGRISALQAPHRLADAILRDSEHMGIAFRASPQGQALNRAALANATPLFALCPTALLFGMWDSTGPKGGLGAKFERAMVAEVVGIDAEWHDIHKARGVRNDPLGIRRKVQVVKAGDGSWHPAGPKDKKTVSPSEINHGNVPFEGDNAGVTIGFAEQRMTLSLICLRRLRFPVAAGEAGAPPTPISEAQGARDLAARTLLAALGLLAATLAFSAGMGLRSRCLLWPDEPMTWELLDTPGAPPRRFALTEEAAIALFDQAVAAARAAGLPWDTTPLVLSPSANLVRLVRDSQLQAVAEDATED